MESRIKEDIKYLKQALKNHKGKWLDAAGVKKYQELAKKLPDLRFEMTDEKRRLCRLIIEEYGITELEAINILNGRNTSDYIAKYERIRTQTPLQIKSDKGEYT